VLWRQTISGTTITEGGGGFTASGPLQPLLLLLLLLHHIAQLNAAVIDDVTIP